MMLFMLHRLTALIQEPGASAAHAVAQEKFSSRARVSFFMVEG